MFSRPLIPPGVVLGWLAIDEAETSKWQARYGAAYASKMAFSVAKGPSDAIRFPAHGPFDQRLGYTDLPQFTQRLQQSGYALTSQARLNEAFERIEETILPCIAMMLDTLL
mgnify:CR=1 FL=1